MNTFILSNDPKEAALFHCNRHVIKMILESAQMLCASHWIHLLRSAGKEVDNFKRIRDAQSWAFSNTPVDFHPPWRMSHLRHPCTLWTAENISNYNWQLSLCESLLEEYTARYDGKTHKAKLVADWLKTNKPIDIVDAPLTNFPVCMKDDFKVYKSEGIIDVVASYRNYYVKDKVRFAKWEPRSTTPEWFTEGVKSGKK